MKRSTTFLQIPFAMAAALGLGAGQAAAAETPPRYAVETVTVRDGHEIAGHELGVIFRQHFDADCRLHRDLAQPDDRPIAASIASKLKLEVELARCPKTAAKPVVSCRWTVKPPPAAGGGLGETKGTGILDSGKLEIEVPKLTGAYDFFLDCDIEVGRARYYDSMHRTLFLTWGAPLLVVTPTDVEWLKIATSWAAGFESTTSEMEILERMLAQLYEYGQKNWRYGFFAQFMGLADAFLPVCSGKGSGRWCHCPWRALVAESSTTGCNYANCYQFSQVFEYIAAVQGIGVFEPVVVRGSKKAGFVTVSDAVSLDPSFPGNIACDKAMKASCPAYAFGSHSLRGRDGKLYDSTFNRIYGEAEAPVMASIQSVKGDRIVLEKQSAQLMEVASAGYGDWGYYRYVPLMKTLPLVGAAADSSKAAPASPPPAIPAVEVVRLLDVEFRPISGPGSSFESLEALLSLAVHDDGRFLVQARLLKDATLISNRPSEDNPGFTRKVVSAVGRHRLDLRFSGEDIYHSRVNGPYQLQVHVIRLATARPQVEDSSRVVAQGSWETDPYKYVEFGTLKADGLALSATFSREQGVEAKATFLVREPDVFVLQARLAEIDGTTVAYAGDRKYQSGPQAEVDLKFPLEPGAGARKPYDLSVELIDREFESVVFYRCRLGGGTTTGGPPPC